MTPNTVWLACDDNDEYQSYSRDTLVDRRKTKDKSKSRVRKDELWKTILRQFRSFFQRDFIEEMAVAHKQKWKEDKIVSHIKAYNNILIEKIKNRFPDLKI